MKEVIIYSTPKCIFCNMAKDFFRRNGIAFEEHDITKEPSRRFKMISKSGQAGVPVISVDGQIFFDFDEPEIKKILGIK